MKRFILKVLLFCACAVVMDMAFGQFFSYMRAHAKGGSTANCEYIANRATDDIIILGSSRATHHYSPSIIEDSLGIRCYNCGEEGNGVILAYGRLKMLTNRYKPKLVLYEITPGYDYGILDQNSKYLGYLRAYYSKNGIREVFDDFDDNLSFLKMRSYMYQNTSRLFPDLYDNLAYRDNHKGYSPLYGHMEDTVALAARSIGQDFTIDRLKLEYLEKVIDLCETNQIPIIFMISPRYGVKDHNLTEYLPAISLCERHGVSVFNFIFSPSISDHAEFFQDEGHMNYKGAEIYSRMVIERVLKSYFKHNNGKE